MAKSNFHPRYKKVAELVRRRILHGDYALKPIPSERRLAEEIGVNYMTVRRGLQILEQENIIIRHSNGRVRVKRVQQGAKKHLNLAYVTPTLASPTLEAWRSGIEQAAASLGSSVRPVLYMHWDDPILFDALEGFDGIFLHPIPEPLPEAVASRLRSQNHPLVVMDNDFSGHGIPSMQLFPPVFIQKLLDHLESLGHQKIGCLNTQPDNLEIYARINQWRYWMAAHGFSARMENHSVAAHENAAERAYLVMRDLLSQPSTGETAWFCTTAPAAMGSMRAMMDRNILPGREIAVCAANGEGVAAMLNPQLTALEAPDATPMIRYCLDWMLRSPERWQGPLLMQPTEVPLVIRESTLPGAGSGVAPELPPPVNGQTSHPIPELPSNQKVSG